VDLRSATATQGGADELETHKVKGLLVFYLVLNCRYLSAAPHSSCGGRDLLRPDPPNILRANQHKKKTHSRFRLPNSSAFKGPADGSPPDREPQTEPKEISTAPVTAVGFASINVEIRT
jgi:hypothetical protein